MAGRDPAKAIARLRPTAVRAAVLAALTRAALKEYEGVYVSEELLDARYRIEASPDGLVVRARAFPPVALKPMAADQFNCELAGVDFTRRGNAITGFTLNMGRAAGIVFRRK